MVSRPAPHHLPSTSTSGGTTRSQSVSKVPVSRAEWEAVTMQANLKQQPQSSSSLRMVSFADRNTAKSERDRHYKPRSQSSTRPNPSSSAGVAPPLAYRHHPDVLQQSHSQPMTGVVSTDLLSPISHSDAVHVQRSFSTGRSARRPSSDVGIGSSYTSTSCDTNNNNPYDDPDEVARAILDLRHKREQQQQRSSSRQRRAERQQQQQPPPSAQHRQQQQPSQPPPQQPPGRSSSRTRPPPPSSSAHVAAPPPPSSYGGSLTHQEPLRRTNSQQSGGSSSQENRNPLAASKNAPSPVPTVPPSRSSTPTQQPQYNHAKQYHHPHPPSVSPPGGLEGNHNNHTGKDKATESIRQAEQRIDGLLQELEDLKFFQEIEHQPTTTHSNNAPHKTLGAIRGRSNSDTLDNNSPPLLKTSKGDVIPTMIRASSPLPPGQRLPPPPNHLSPRKISKMDRTSLELETQTLVRQVQELLRDKQDLEVELEQLQSSLRHDQRTQKKKVQQLEVHLQQLSKQLQSAKCDMEVTRSSLEQQLQQRQQQLDQTQNELQSLHDEREQLQVQVQQQQRDHQLDKAQWKDELKREKDQYTSREAVLELQLGQVNDDLTDCQQQVTQLQQQLEQTKQESEQQLHHNEEAFQVRLTSMQEELSLAQDKLKKAIGENTTKSKKIKEYTEQLESSKKQSDEQLHLISDMTERLDTIHAEYREKFQELKQLYEAKEKRRLDEMVESHSSQNKEYEKRLVALQEQLKHANDRHYEERRQQKAEHDKQLQAQSELLNSQHKEALGRVQEELEAVRTQFDQTVAEKSQLKDQLQVETERPKAEIQQRDQEIDRLTNKSEKLTELVSEKDEQLKELTNLMSEQESRHISRLSQVESSHAEALMARDEVIATQKREFRVLEVQLRNELTGREAELSATKAELDSRVVELQLELKKANAALAEAHASLEENRNLDKTVVELRSAISRLQGDLTTERTSHESCVAEMRVEIAKLEGKLRAGESSLKQKRDLIDDLEEKLRSISLSDKVTLEQAQQELERTQHQLQRERAETSQQHLVEIADWEAKVQRQAEALRDARSTISKLERCVQDLSEDNSTTTAKLEQLRVELESSNATIAEYELKLNERTSIESQLELNAKHAEDASEQFKQVQDELQAERKSNNSLLNKLRDLEADLELKEHQIRRLPKLQDQLKELILGREHLQEQLGRVEAELERKDKHIKQLSDRNSSSNHELLSKVEEMKRSKESLESQLRLMEQELQAKSERAERTSRQVPELMSDLNEKTKLAEDMKAQLARAEQENQKLKSQLAEISGASDFSVELQSKVEHLTKAKAILEGKIQDLEDEREEREKQVRQSSERYSNQIVDLQMQVEELSRSKTSFLARLSQIESELEKKDELLSVTSSQHSGDLNTLHSKLAEQLDQKSKLEAKLRAVEAKLAENDRCNQQVAEQQVLELQSKYDVGVKECRALRLKIGDVEAELERKEKQIKDVVNRYSQEIADLKDKLEEESRSNAALRKDAEQLRGDASTASSMSYEANAIKDRLAAMEKSVEVERALARDSDNARIRLEEELAAAEKARQELELRFDKVNSERTEVITALEDVIHEVQSREEEIESLAHILRKRDEELEHAKYIATKALASAQDLRTRYNKERGSERQAELTDKITELNKNLEFLTNKNDELQRRTTRLEEQLRASETECSNLKSKLNKQDTMSRRPPKIDRFISLSDPKRSPEDSPTGSDGFESLSDAASIEYNDAASADVASTPGWIRTFDSGSTDSGDNGSMSGVKTEPADMSRRSIERDALRKYVRKRYLKSKGSC